MEHESKGVEDASRYALPTYAEQILENIPSGVMALDRDGRIIVANTAACRFLQGDASQFAPGIDLEDLPIAGPFMDVLREVMDNRQPVSRREVILTWPGEQRKKEIGLSASLLAGPEDFNGVIFLFTDMTERRNMERANEINTQLASLGELTAGVVHELRNPVMVISGMAEWLLRKAPNEELRDTANTIFQEAAHLEKTISQFLGFARPFELEVATCHARTILERAERLCQHRAASKTVSLETAVDTDLPEMEADPGRAAQALANIINNAIDAVDEGAGRVTVTVTRADGDILFEVLDNGPGVGAQEGENLFKPFFSRKAGGTGLGLAIVHRIITAHGGTVTHENPPGGGARFLIRLPIQKGALW